MRLRLDDLTWREIDGDLVVLDLRTSTYLTTNLSATFLMKQLAEERTDSELTDALVSEFAISRAAAERDVHTFVDDLDRRGLLVHA
ncbi:PqqD family protein [Microlunatus aurantiacus]